MSGPAFVQACYVDARNTDPGVTFGSSLTTGNLVIAAAWFGDGGSFYTSNTGGWTFIGSASVGTGAITLWGRIVASGDGTGSGYGKFSSGNSNNTNACAAEEISGAAATVGGAVELFHIDDFSGSNANTEAITTQTTGNANDLAVLFAFNELVVFPAQPSLGSPFTGRAGHAGFTEGGEVGDNVYVSSGSSVNCTITYGTGDSKQGAALVIVKGGSVPSTETAAVTMALSGVSFSVGEARLESAAATLALGGISYTGHAVDERTAAATLVLGQANFIINALDVTAITSLVHFYTF